MSDIDNKSIKVSMDEMITLNLIMFKQEKYKLQMADQVISIYKRIITLGPDTPITELNEMQEQLRAMLNQAEADIKDMEEDKKFINRLQERKTIIN